MKKVPRKKAEEVVTALLKKYPDYEDYPPVIFDPEHEEQRDGTWVISWEGPEDWVYDFEWTDPKFWFDRINHFAIVILPKD